MDRTQNFVIQFVKYTIVGILNTAITASTIWLMLAFFSNGVDDSHSDAQMIFANILGYSLGLANSFVLNRRWTFRSNARIRITFTRFIMAFLLCYLLQLGIVMWLDSSSANFGWQISIGRHLFSVTSAYSCQLIGMLCFTLLNFLLNKHYTFRKCTQYS